VWFVLPGGELKCVWHLFHFGYFSHGHGAMDFYPMVRTIIARRLIANLAWKEKFEHGPFQLTVHAIVPAAGGTKSTLKATAKRRGQKVLHLIAIASYNCCS